MTTHAVLQPVTLPFIGDVKSRVVMSAMTRSFATQNHLCTPNMASYYERRAKGGVGLILTEGIIVHPSGDGYNNVPHLQTLEQADSWAPTLAAVHRHGSKTYAQLWHCGRISHGDFTSGFDVVSSTDQPAAGTNRQNGKPYGVPRPLRTNEFDGIYDMFCQSADLAVAAGFDGIQLHMGHGYLVDQFLDARINDRRDTYGGSVMNRCRMAIELVGRIIDRIGASKVMVRISPSRMMGGLYEWPDMQEMLDHLIPAFDRVGLRQLDVSCANADYFQTSGKVIADLRRVWPHLLIGGASLSIEDADREVTQGRLDMVTWGRAILANPDFVQRLLAGSPLVPFDDSMRKTLT